MKEYIPKTTIDYDKEYENYSDCYVDGAKQKILWPFKAVKDSIYRNSKGNGRMSIMFINKNMYGFNTVKDASISIINRIRKRTVNDDYLPTVYGVGCLGQGFDTEVVIDGKRISLPEYVKWRSMLSRCYSNDKASAIYRECGHYVCHEWLCYEYFCKTLPSVYGYADWVANGKTGYGCRGFVDDNISAIHNRESDIWRDRIAKMSNPNHPQYYAYGGSGVTMWYEWRCFEYFSRDIKFLPGYDLWLQNQGEYDLDKDVKFGFIPKSQRPREYSPETCQFITHKINMAQASFDRTYPNSLPAGKYIGVSIADGNYLTTFMGISRGRFTNPIAAASYYNLFARYNNYPPHLMNNLGAQEMDIMTIQKYKLDETRIDGTKRYKMIDSLY